MIQRVICNFDPPAEALCVWIILACNLAFCVHKPVHCYVVVQLWQAHDVIQLLHNDSVFGRACMH